MTTLPPTTNRLPLVAQAMLAFAFVVMVGVNLFYGPQIAGERLPMQWGLDGAPTWFAPRAFSLWSLVVVTVAFGPLLLLRRRRDQAAPSQSSWRASIVFVFVMTAAQLFHVFMLLRWAAPQT